MLYILLTSIVVNIIGGFVIYILTRRYVGLKARNAVLVGNVIEMKNYYDLYTSNTVAHTKDEKKRQEATDNEAKQHILDIIAYNNAESNRLHKS